MPSLSIPCSIHSIGGLGQYSRPPSPGQTCPRDDRGQRIPLPGRIRDGCRGSGSSSDSSSSGIGSGGLNRTRFTAENADAGRAANSSMEGKADAGGGAVAERGWG